MTAVMPLKQARIDPIRQRLREYHRYTCFPTDHRPIHHSATSLHIVSPISTAFTRTPASLPHSRPRSLAARHDRSDIPTSLSSPENSSILLSNTLHLPFAGHPEPEDSDEVVLFALVTPSWSVLSYA